MGSAWAATLYLGARFRSHSVFVPLYKKHPLAVAVIVVIVKRFAGKNHLPDDVLNLSQTAPLPKDSKGCHLASTSEPGLPRAFDYRHHCHLHCLGLVEQSVKRSKPQDR